MATVVAPRVGSVGSDWLEARYRESGPAALRLAFLLTGDHALAEDLTHEAFIRVATRLRRLRNPDAFDAYLRRTVANLARSHLRHRAVVRRHLERQGAPPVEGDESSNYETRDLIWRALQRLPARQREAIVCRFYLQLSERETAECLGCRPGTVKSALSRGLDDLRRRLATDWGER